MGRVNITEYFKTQERIFVRNRTNPLGVVSIPLVTERGESSFALPKTVIPIELTAYVPKEYLVKSAGFRTLVQKGAIELLTEEEFNSIVTPQDLEAVDRLTSLTSGMGSTDAGVGTTVEKGVTVNPRVMQLMNMMNIDDTSELAGLRPSTDGVIVELQNMDLTEDDLAYIVANSTGRIKEWAISKLTGNKPVVEESTSDTEVEIKDTAPKRRRKS